MEKYNFNRGYEPTAPSFWMGRVDSEDNYDAFRWHQWITCVDLRMLSTATFEHELGICFIGFCSDIGVERNLGRPGTAKGPNSIRNELKNRPCAFSPGLKLYDAGNIYGQSGDLEKAQKDLENAVDVLLEKGLVPIVLGGGHAVALGHYHGVRKYLERVNPGQTLGIVNFDAHFDIRPYTNGGTSGTMFRQIADYCAAENVPYNYLCLGIQKSGNTVDLFKTAHRLGVEYLLASDIEAHSASETIVKIQDFINRNDQLYMTICADVFSSAYAPGVSAAQPLGLYPEKALKVIKHIVKSKKMASFDIAEVSPRFDHDNTTASLAAILIFSVVVTLAEEHALDIKYK